VGNCREGSNPSFSAIEKPCSHAAYGVFLLLSGPTFDPTFIFKPKNFGKTKARRLRRALVHLSELFGNNYRLMQRV
jgi:hypothetical protein